MSKQTTMDAMLGGNRTNNGNEPSLRKPSATKRRGGGYYTFEYGVTKTTIEKRGAFWYHTGMPTSLRDRLPAKTRTLAELKEIWVCWLYTQLYPERETFRRQLESELGYQAEHGKW